MAEWAGASCTGTAVRLQRDRLQSYVAEDEAMQ